MPTVETHTDLATLLTIKKYYNKNMVVISDQSQPPVYLELLNTVSRGDSIPGWRKLISNGLNATTLMSGRRETLDAQDYVYIIKQVPRVNPANWVLVEARGNHTLSSPSFPSYSSYLDSAVNRSLINLYSHVQAEETKFKGLVFSGELRESLSMIRHPASALRKGISGYLNDIKRYRQLPRRKRVSAVRRTWLEYSFGWSPLVSDIDAGIRAFYASDLVKPIFEMVRGRSRTTCNPAFINTFRDMGLGVLRFRVYDFVDIEVKHYGVYRHAGSGTNNLHHYGFRPNEFIPTLWELIPYSFLVDYFTNIGKILESWSYRSGGLGFVAQGTACSEKRVMDNVRFIRNQDDNDFYYEVKSDSPGTYAYERRFIERLPDIGQALPSLELRCPGNWSQWINIAALTANLRSSRNVLNH